MRVLLVARMAPAAPAILQPCESGHDILLVFQKVSARVPSSRVLRRECA